MQDKSGNSDSTTGINSNPLLHVHAQYASHEEVWILGNKEALQKLHQALGQLLEGKGTASNNTIARGVGMWANDGEGYNVMLLLDEDKARWQQAALGYTADYMPKAGLHPSEIISPEAYKAEFERGVKDLS